MNARSARRWQRSALSTNANIFISDANTLLDRSISLNPAARSSVRGVTAASFDAFFGIGTPAQGTLAPRPAVNQPRPTMSNSPLTLNTDSQARGFNMVNNSGSTLIALLKSGLTVTDLDISTTANSASQYAVSFTNSSGTFAFGSITVAGSNAGSGVNFSGTTSGSTVNFGNVSTSTGDAVTIATSGATNFSFANVASTTGKAVSVENGNRRLHLQEDQRERRAEGDHRQCTHGRGQASPSPVRAASATRRTSA